jgi:DHA2 family multidrug resistance protein
MAATLSRRYIAPHRGMMLERGNRLAIVIAVACVAIFLDASTSYESSVALPYIAGAVAATPDQASWIITLFNAAYDTAILLSPWFLTRFGRRNYFVGSLLGFAVCSVGCGLASDYHLFVLLRLLQGFAQGGFFACGVLSLFRSAPDSHRLFGVMLFSMSSQMGSAIGPAVAGFLVYHDAWQAVFLLSAVPAFVLALGIHHVLREPVEPERAPFDLVGAVLIALTFLALQYVVNEGERRNWADDPWVIVALIIAPLCGAAMLLWKLRYSPHPFLDFRVLRHRNLVLGAIFGLGFGILLQAATQIGGFVEQMLDFTPELGGGLDALRAIAILLVVPLVTFTIAKNILDVRSALIVGLIATFLGFRLEVLATTTGSDFTSFIASFAAIGIGIAILYRALASVIFGTLPGEDFMMGLLIYKMSGVIGGAIAVPIFAVFLDHETAAHQNVLVAGVSLAKPAVRAFIASTHGNIATLAHSVSMQAATLAYSDLWSLASLTVIALVPFVFLLDLRPAQAGP